MAKILLPSRVSSPERIQRALAWRNQHMPSMSVGSRALHAVLGLTAIEALDLQNAALLGFERWRALSSSARYPAGGVTDFTSLDLKEILEDLQNPELTKGEKILILKVIQIGQAPFVFENWESGDALEEKQGLLGQLAALEDFYGIENYQAAVQKLVKIAKGSPQVVENPKPPQVIDVTSNDPVVKDKLRKAQIAALENLPFSFVGVVAGGIAKRFGFSDPEGRPQPKGKFPFTPIMQKTLFRVLAENVLALRNLYYLTFGRKAEIPMVFMTSPANDEATKENFQREEFYGLGEENLMTFQQVMVPLVDAEGNWMMKSESQINAAPHGHGDWLYGLEKSGIAYALLNDHRNHGLGVQIEDAGAFIYSLENIGLGIISHRPFGFSTIPRKAGFAEGSIVMVERQGETSIINIEYTNLKASGISDEADPSTGYSRFPGNTAVYYENLTRLLKLIEQNPFPGEIINLSNKNRAFREGRRIELIGDRPEAQRQGIAEAIRGTAENELPHTLGYPRRFFIPVKESYDPEKFNFMADKTAETARQQFINIFVEWLSGAGMKIPSRTYKAIDKKGNEETLTLFDSVVIELTPCFANRPEILIQKVRGGEIEEGSTLYLSGFHSEIKDLSLRGALSIEVENEIGPCHGNHIIPDSNLAGKYRIKGATIRNHGQAKKLDDQGIWHGELEDKEKCRIVIQGNGELEIKPGVIISGDFELIVKDGERVIIEPDGKKGYRITKSNIDKESSWHYKLEINPDSSDPEFVKLRTIRPADIGRFSLQHPDKIIDLNHILSVPSIIGQLDELHQRELQILNQVFEVEGSLVYEVDFRKEEQTGQPNPYLIVKAGTKKGTAEMYSSRVDGEPMPAISHKSRTIIPTLQQKFEIFVDPVDPNQGEAFKGKHYIAVPNRAGNEIILLIGEFDESLDSVKKEEAFTFKHNSLIKFAGDEELDVTKDLREQIRRIFHSIKWSDFFELGIRQIYFDHIKPIINPEPT